MSKKSKLLNVRAHLDHVQLIIEGLQKYGMCPALEHELKVCSLINKAIIRNHDAKKATGSRKDIYVSIKE